MCATRAVLTFLVCSCVRACCLAVFGVFGFPPRLAIRHSTPLRYGSLGSSRGSFDTPSRPGRLRARQLGLEGTTAINSEEDLAEYLRYGVAVWRLWPLSWLTLSPSVSQSQGRAFTDDGHRHWCQQPWARRWR